MLKPIDEATFTRLRAIVVDFHNCMTNNQVGSRDEQLATDQERDQANTDIDALEELWRKHRA